MGSESKATKNDMEKTGGRKCGESRVEDQGSCKSKMEGRCESDCGRDEVYSATFGDEERTGLKLDGDDDDETAQFTQVFTSCPIC